MREQKILRWRSKVNKRMANSVRAHVHTHHTSQDTLQRHISQLLYDKSIHIHTTFDRPSEHWTMREMSWHDTMLVSVTLRCIRLILPEQQEQDP
jgi:hypothetical protein